MEVKVLFLLFLFLLIKKGCFLVFKVSCKGEEGRD